jgi:uncharacterized protein YwgA
MVTTNDLNFLLETIYFSGTVNGRKRLQKTICVLKYRDNIPLGFNYIPYYYGPYSEELAESIQSLIGAGYLNEQAEEIAQGVYQYSYSLTEQGQQSIQPLLNDNIAIYNTRPQQLENLINQINIMELNELVRLSKSLNLDQEQITV